MKKFIVAAAALASLGVVLIVVGPSLLRTVVDSQLVLTPSSRTYHLWKEIPFDVPMNFYFFNWTNPEDAYKEGVKPRFEQVGPYMFHEREKKSGIVWNQNGTVTFKRMRVWKYREEEGNGDLRDNITMVNPTALATAYVARTWNYLVRKGLSLTLLTVAPTINITRTVNQLLFEGYPDSIMKLAKNMPFFSGHDVPLWDRFGWFYGRNNSADFEGTYTMGTGTNSTYASLYRWNHWEDTPFFEGSCARVGGSTGELFPPCENRSTITLFSSALCRTIVLEYAGKRTVENIEGNMYVAGDYMFDNGTLYPENECYCNGDCLPSGVFNVSSCRFGSPSFGSLPHFHKADPYYRDLIEGMEPDDEKHAFFVTLEPTTGAPLEVNVRLQLNLFVQPIPGILLYEKAPKAFFPMLWFEQKVKIPSDEAFTLKLVLGIPAICSVIGILAILICLALLCYIFYKKWSERTEQIKEKDKILYQEMVPLKRR